MKLFKIVFFATFGLIGVVFLILGIVFRTASSTDPDLPILAATFCILGALFLFIALAALLILSDRRHKRLLDTGVRAIATVTDIRPNYGVKLNGRSPYRVYAQCTHPITHETVTLHSHDLFELHVSTGQTVEIAFDPMNEKRYAFDLSKEARS